jgi:hypothetical protein
MICSDVLKSGSRDGTLADERDGHGVGAHAGDATQRAAWDALQRLA